MKRLFNSNYTITPASEGYGNNKNSKDFEVYLLLLSAIETLKKEHLFSILSGQLSPLLTQGTL